MKRTIFRGLLFFLFSGVLIADTASAQVTVETFEVAHYRAYCEGVVPKKCLVVMPQGAKDFGTIFDEIENFDFIPGYHYKLRVEVEKVAAPPKDTSGYIYRLKEVVSRKNVAGADADGYLYGTKWRLTKIKGEAVKQEAGAWAVFQGHARAVYGYGGCNSFRGDFSRNGGDVKFGPVASTLAACLIDWGVEEGFLKALGGAARIEIGPDRLVLSEDGKPLLEFRPYE